MFFDEEGVKVFTLKNCLNRFLVKNLYLLKVPNCWKNPARKPDNC